MPTAMWACVCSEYAKLHESKRNEKKDKNNKLNMINFLQHFRRRVSVHSYLHWLSNGGSQSKRAMKKYHATHLQKKSSSFITIKWVRIYVWRWSFLLSRMYCSTTLSLKHYHHHKVEREKIELMRIPSWNNTHSPPFNDKIEPINDNNYRHFLIV